MLLTRSQLSAAIISHIFVQSRFFFLNFENRKNRTGSLLPSLVLVLTVFRLYTHTRKTEDQSTCHNTDNLAVFRLTDNRYPGQDLLFQVLVFVQSRARMQIHASKMQQHSGQSFFSFFISLHVVKHDQLTLLILLQLIIV